MDVNFVQSYLLPELHEFSVDDIEIRDRDSERKGNGKYDADAKRNASESDVQAGDSVLVRQVRENKLHSTLRHIRF